MENEVIENNPSNPVLSTPANPQAVPPVANKTPQTKPLLIISLVLLILILFGGIGFLVYQNSQLKKQQSLQVKPTPTKVSPAPKIDPTANWQSFSIDLFNLQYKLPSELERLGTLKKTISSGETGSQVCWMFPNSTSRLVKSVYAGGGACTGNKFFFGTISQDYEAGRDMGFTDTLGYKTQNEKYYFLNMSGQTIEIPQELVKEITNNSGVKMLKVKGDDGPPMEEFGGQGFPVSGTPGKGYIGALINTGSSQYPGLAVQMELDATLTETIFDQILSTFKFTN